MFIIEAPDEVDLEGVAVDQTTTRKIRQEYESTYNKYREQHEKFAKLFPKAQKGDAAAFLELFALLDGLINYLLNFKLINRKAVERNLGYSGDDDWDTDLKTQLWKMLPQWDDASTGEETFNWLELAFWRVILHKVESGDRKGKNLVFLGDGFDDEGKPMSAEARLDALEYAQRERETDTEKPKEVVKKHKKQLRKLVREKHSKLAAYIVRSELKEAA